jgi:hypothetical protein
MATKAKATKKKPETIEDIVRRIVKEEIKKHLSIRLSCWSDGGNSAYLEWDGNDL